MKTSEIANKYGLSSQWVTTYIMKSGYKYEYSFGSYTVTNEIAEIISKEIEVLIQNKNSFKKAQDIAEELEVSLKTVNSYIEESGHEYTVNLDNYIVSSETAALILQEMKDKISKDIQQQQEKRKAISSMLISSGFNFDGYKIKKYSGYISGDDVEQIDRGVHGFFTSATNVGPELMKSLTKMRRQALSELKEAAYDLGCNAVIGVDFDYITLDPETASSSGKTVYLPYVFGVTANGNAVIIEKDEGY